MPGHKIVSLSPHHYLDCSLCMTSTPTLLGGKGQEGGREGGEEGKGGWNGEFKGERRGEEWSGVGGKRRGLC